MKNSRTRGRLTREHVPTVTRCQPTIYSVVRDTRAQRIAISVGLGLCRGVSAAAADKRLNHCVRTVRHCRGVGLVRHRATRPAMVYDANPRRSEFAYNISVLTYEWAYARFYDRPME